MCDTNFALGCSRQFPGEKLLNQLYYLCDDYLVVMPCFLTLGIGQKNHWQRLQPSHKRLFMDILSSMADFAASYNSDLNLRSRMQHVCGDRYAYTWKFKDAFFRRMAALTKFSSLLQTSSQFTAPGDRGRTGLPCSAQQNSY